MIFIFHGTNIFQSRKQLNVQIDLITPKQTLRLDKKTINLETINNFLNTISFLEENKVLVLDDFFSIPKSKKRLLIEDILNQSNQQIFIWQPKKVTIAQIKSFPKSKAYEFNLSSQLFSCVYSIKPNNLRGFLTSLNNIKETEPFELILHLIKQNLRKQLTSKTFPLSKIKVAYLNLIELDYQSKTGNLSTDKFIALERIIISLLN